MAEEIVPERDFSMLCSQTLSRTVKVRTSDYIYCDDGIDTSETNWKNAYVSSNYHTPLQLIQLLKEALIDMRWEGHVFKTPEFTERLIRECDGWCNDDTEFIEE